MLAVIGLILASDGAAMPVYMTNLILVFSGLLTGYLLWYRDKRNETLLQKSLKKDNNDLRSSLTLAHATHRQLNDRFQRQKSQLAVLQRLCDDLNAASQHAVANSTNGTETLQSQDRILQAVDRTHQKGDGDATDQQPLDLKASLEELTAENLALQKRLENQQATISQITEGNKKALVEKEEKHTEQVNRLEDRICSQAESIKKTDQHLQELALKLDHSQKKLAVAESALMESNSRTALLSTKIEDLKATCLRISQYESHMQGVEIENKKLISIQKELSSEISNLRNENKRSKADSIEKLDFQKTRALELSETIEKLKLSNDQLQQECSDLSVRLANQQSIVSSDSAIISFAEAMEQRKSQSQQFDAEHQGHLVKHSRRGMLFESPPQKPDNLKFISGITEILEARLNDCGIYTYKQILNWSEEAVSEFSNQLGIAESLITQTWKQQAEFLAQSKAGRAAA